MLMELEDPAVVESQTFPHCVTPVHRRIERANSGLVTMHQLSVDVYDQVAVSLVEFLKHLNYLTRRPLRRQRKTFLSMTVCPLCSLCEILNVVGIYKVPDSIHSNAGRSHAIAPELCPMLGDTAEMRSFSPPRRTNISPRCRRCHGPRVARTTSIR